MKEADGFDIEEWSQLEKIANVTVEESKENNLQVVNYVLEPKMPLVKLTKSNGSVEKINEKVVYSRIVKMVTNNPQQKKNMGFILKPYSPVFTQIPKWIMCVYSG